MCLSATFLLEEDWHMNIKQAGRESGWSADWENIGREGRMYWGNINVQGGEAK